MKVVINNRGCGYAICAFKYLMNVMIIYLLSLSTLHYLKYFYHPPKQAESGWVWTETTLARPEVSLPTVEVE